MRICRAADAVMRMAQVYPNRTLEQCEGICSRSNKCSVYTYDSAVKSCSLKTKCGFNRVDNAQRSGTRRHDPSSLLLWLPESKDRCLLTTRLEIPSSKLI